MIFGYASLMVSLARNILFVPLYLHRIPLAQYGAWLATGGALALMLINDYGLSGVVTQRISAAFGAGETASLGRLAGSAVAIGVLLSLLLSAVSLVFVPFLPGLGSLTSAESQTVIDCFIIAVAANGLGVVGASAASVLRSLQRVTVMGCIGLAAELANVGVILVGLLHGYGLYSLAMGMLLRALILALGGMVGVWLVCVRGLALRVTIDLRSVRDFTGEASRFFLASTAMKLQAQANVFFVSAILGPASAALYSLTVRAHETVQMVMGLINGALVPSVTHLFGSGNLVRFRAVLLRLLVTLSTLTAFAMTVTVIGNPAFLHLWVGSYAFAGQGVSILMAMALFVSSLGYIGYDALLAQGNFRFVTRVFVATSVMQLIALVALLRLGLWIAPLVTMLTAAAWGTAFWRRVGSDVGITGSEAKGLLAEIARILGVSAAGAIGFSAFYPAPTSWALLILELGIAAVCLTAAYLASSPSLRGIVQEEIGATLRALRPT